MIEADFVFMLLAHTNDGNLALLAAIPNISWSECLQHAFEANQLMSLKFGVCMPVIR